MFNSEIVMKLEKSIIGDLKKVSFKSAVGVLFIAVSALAISASETANKELTKKGESTLTEVGGNAVQVGAAGASELKTEDGSLLNEILKSVETNELNSKPYDSNVGVEPQEEFKREAIIKKYKDSNYRYLFKVINGYQEFSEKLKTTPDLKSGTKRWVYEDLVERALLVEKMIPLLKAGAQSSKIEVPKKVILERHVFFEKLKNSLNSALDTKEFINTIEVAMNEVDKRSEAVLPVVKLGVHVSGSKPYAIAKEELDFYINARISLDSMKTAIERRDTLSSAEHFLDDFEQKIIKSLSHSKFSKNQMPERGSNKAEKQGFVAVSGPSVGDDGDGLKVKLSKIGENERVNFLGKKILELQSSVGTLGMWFPQLLYELGSDTVHVVPKVLSGEPMKEMVGSVKERVMVGGLALSSVIHKDSAKRALNDLREKYGFEQIIISDFDKLSKLEQFEKCAQISVRLERFQEKMGLEKRQVGLNGEYKLHLTSASTMKATGMKAFVSVEANTLVLADFDIDNIAHEWVHMLDSKIKEDALVRLGVKVGKSERLNAKEQEAKEKWKLLSKEEQDQVIRLTLYSDFPDELKKINMKAYESFWKLRSALHSVEESKSKEEFARQIKEEVSSENYFGSVGLDKYEVVLKNAPVDSLGIFGVKANSNQLKKDVSKMLSASVLENSLAIIENFKRELKNNYESSQLEVSKEPMSKKSLISLQNNLKELQSFNLSSEKQKISQAWGNSKEAKYLIDAFASGVLKEIDSSGGVLLKDGGKITKEALVRDIREQINSAISELPEKWIKSKEDISIENLKSMNHELGGDLLFNLRSKFVSQSVVLDHSRIEKGVFSQRYWTQPAEEMARAIGRSTEISERLESSSDEIKPGATSAIGAAYTPKYDAKKMYKINSAFAEFASAAGVRVDMSIDALDAIEVVSNESFKVKEKVAMLWAHMSDAVGYKVVPLKMEEAVVVVKLAAIDFFESSKSLNSSLIGANKVMTLTSFREQRGAQNKPEVSGGGIDSQKVKSHKNK